MNKILLLGADGQLGVAIYSYDLSSFIWKIISSNYFNKFESKLFNFSNNGEIVSWYDFARKVLEYSGKYSDKVINIKPISTNQYNQAAKRPYYSVLNSSRVDKEFDIDRSNWNDSLRKALIKID